MELKTKETTSKMPQLGLGTWKAPTGVVSKVVLEAIRKGYRAIDCACDYGNESEVGEGITQALRENENIKRDDLFITSKLWNTYHRHEHVRPALMKTLGDLNLEYLDLYLIHFPIPLKYVTFEKRYPPEWIHDPESRDEACLVLDNVRITETWKALEELVDEGLIKHIGICNYPAILVMELLKSCKIKPSVLQIELHPYLQQSKLIEFCNHNDIKVTAFSPFGAASYKSLGMDQGDDLFSEGVLKKISETHGRSVAQVMLRWAVQRGTIVIPKTCKVERLTENMDVFDWSLSEQDMLDIKCLEKGKRYNDPGVFCTGMGMSIPIYD